MAFLSELLSFQRPYLSGFLMMAGVLVMLATAISIAFESNYRARIKGVVILVTLLAGLLLFAPRPHLNLSARLYYWRDAEQLTRIVEMVRPLDTRAYIWRNRPCAAYEDVPTASCQKLQEITHRAGIHRTWKHREAVVFETWGMLDARWGLQFCTAEDEAACADRRQARIAEGWYVWTIE